MSAGPSTDHPVGESGINIHGQQRAAQRFIGAQVNVFNLECNCIMLRSTAFPPARNLLSDARGRRLLFLLQFG